MEVTVSTSICWSIQCGKNFSPHCYYIENIGLLETDPGIAEGRQILVARALVDPSKGRVPVRLFNTSSVPTTLYKGSHVGVISSVNNVIETGF